MAITREKIRKKYVLELDEKEKDFLQDYLQNSHSQEEDIITASLRESLFISLKDCIKERS